MFFLPYTACTAIAKSNNVSLTCTSASDSHGDPNGGFLCNVGLYQVPGGVGQADVCQRMFCSLHAPL